MLLPTPDEERAGAFEVFDGWRWEQAEVASLDVDFVETGVERGRLGLYDAAQYEIVRGDCADCRVSELIAWWFADELIGVPSMSPMPPSAEADRAVAATAGSVRSMQSGSRADRAAQGMHRPGQGGAEALPETRHAAHGAHRVRNGDPELAAGQSPALPSRSVWLGAPQRVVAARLDPTGRVLRADGDEIAFAVSPPIETNLAYVDASTVRFFAARPVTVRGAVTLVDDSPVFVARTIFPEDQRIDLGAETDPLDSNEFLATLVEAQAGPSVGAGQRVLFSRPGGKWAGRPVLALVLTGAQGDDFGSRGGHLAMATGVLGERGEWRDWLVTNFYPLVEGNAKGIIPATLPMDNYLYELNSGQLYYRPGYMLVAVLREERAAAAVQEALDETLQRLYCGEIEFDLSRMNSTAMTIDAVRSLGWRIPPTGVTSRIAGLAAAPIATLARRSFAVGRNVYRAFAAEKTRLLPRVAFEVAGHDLLYLASLPEGAEERAALTSLERMLAEDIEAIIWVRLPQVPSSRRFGTYPAASLLTYGTSVLAAPGDFEGSPESPPRPFSERLREFCPAP